MKLLHLYHDIMNLYGDYANIVAMESLLKKSGHDVEVCKRSLENALTAEKSFS